MGWTPSNEKQKIKRIKYKKSLVLSPLQWTIPGCRGSTYPMCMKSHWVPICVFLWHCGQHKNTLPCICFPSILISFPLCSSLLLPWNHSSKYSFSFKLVFLDLSWETSLLFHDNCVSSTVLGALNILSQQLNDINILNIVISVLQVRNWDTEILRIFHKVL